MKEKGPPFPSTDRTFPFERLSLTPAPSRWERENYPPIIGCDERLEQFMVPMRAEATTDGSPTIGVYAMIWISGFNPAPRGRKMYFNFGDGRMRMTRRGL